MTTISHQFANQADYVLNAMNNPKTFAKSINSHYGI
jgi:predicted transposase YbfD/YdcC